MSRANILNRTLVMIDNECVFRQNVGRGYGKPALPGNGKSPKAHLTYKELIS